MNQTPRANRKHITLYGNTNSGKSSLFNAIIGQKESIISSIKGTTTDPIIRSMELIPFGPVTIIDTAGLDDEGELGNLRIKKSLKMLQRTDLALYIMDINNLDEDSYKKTIREFKKYKVPHILIINKIDTVSKDILKNIKEKYPEAIYTSINDNNSILNLKEKLINELSKEDKEKPIVGDLVPYNGTVILVVPIDSEAPKGRIILPQVQVIRDCLDHGIKSYVVRDTELENAISDLKHIDLVITDSQAFKRVNKIVPKEIKLTSFSILFARYKGELDVFLDGINMIDKLNENSKILIAESCTHTTSHEDIGRVKIPNMLNKYTGKKLNFEFISGHDFPEDLSKYDLIIHCGACMMNEKEMKTRIRLCKEKKVSIINYGIILSYLNGILDRTMEIFIN
ncbi:[FeFe] hydrogenase H-cluster maturation GTPase HydF [Defluviitalea phaphyphila]|uniref:[FeFe] hydrogenase H-cluster maturation GTPase HydF n=1 Tax=Defluviitalea phaphyphila TaxID=1473580 RepID=UPI0007316061|nr:[FeFe] hydrogenase H-cluster maturation GTPase HydF [Defluviitalea phaphyphila]